MTARKKAIAAIRRACVQNAKTWGEIEFAETKIGRLEHKIEKLKICSELVPGVEMLERMAFSGDFGLTIIDFAPWGVIGAVTPATHSVPTLTGNAINMLAAGNAVVLQHAPLGLRRRRAGHPRLQRGDFCGDGDSRSAGDGRQADAPDFRHRCASTRT